MEKMETAQSQPAARPISRVLASKLTDSEIDMVSGGFDMLEACNLYTQTCTRDRYGNNVDCGPVTCD